MQTNQYQISFCHSIATKHCSIFSTQPLESYVNKPTPLYRIYALDMSISVCLVKMERYSDKFLVLYLRYQIN